MNHDFLNTWVTFISNLDIIKSEDMYHHILAIYNRRVGLPSILISSIIASMLLGINTYFGVKLYNETWVFDEFAAHRCASELFFDSYQSFSYEFSFFRIRAR